MHKTLHMGSYKHYLQINPSLETQQMRIWPQTSIHSAINAPWLVPVLQLFSPEVKKLYVYGLGIGLLFKKKDYR